MSSHVVLPLCPPPEPSTNPKHQKLLQKYLQEEAAGTDESHIPFNFPADDRLWPVFADEVAVSKEAKLEPLARVAFEHHELTASTVWVRAYVRALDDVLPLTLTLRYGARHWVMRASQQLFRTLQYMEGVNDGSPVIHVAAADLNLRPMGTFSAPIDTWNALVTDWNSQRAARIPCKLGSSMKRVGEASGDTLPAMLMLGGVGVDEEEEWYASSASFPRRQQEVFSLEPGCSCGNHLHTASDPLQGKAIAACFQAQRRLHYALASRDAFSTEVAVEQLDNMDASEKVVEILHAAFPYLSKAALQSQRERYLQKVLDDPVARGRAGSKRALPKMWPPCEGSL